jgi:hypothetical protein
MQSSRRLLLLPVALALASSLGSCTATNQAPISWRELKLPGTVLVLESESEVEELRFLGETEGGWVVVTVGSKNGPLAGPVYPWRIEGESLVIGHGKEFERLEFLSLGPRSVAARRSSGQVVHFRRVKD